MSGADPGEDGPDSDGEDASTRMYRERADVVTDVAGEGPPVVFSHGTLMDRRMFAPQLEALAPEFRCLAYSSRARTDRYAGPYDLDDLADDCAAVMDHYGVDSAVLAGMSMGGFMALRFALRYPERLEGLVLIDSMAGPHPEAEREQYGAMLDQLRETPDVPEGLAGIVANLLFGETSNAQRQGLVDRWVDRWLTYPSDAVIAEVESWLHREGVLDRLGEIDVPVLAVHGEEDTAIDPTRAETVAQGVPDGRLELIPEAGHSSNLENPDPVNAELRAFLDLVY
jgi:pimeloyl-ACP methyl ester carboxylesterase